MKLLQTIILTCFLSPIFSQSIAERELDLRSYKSGEKWGQKKDKAIELLTIDTFNIIAIDYILRLYQEAGQNDSISAFYLNLIKDNPKSPTPYLIRVKLSQYESLTNTSKIKYLKKAREIDSLNVQANYGLGKLYYELFIKEQESNRTKRTLYAESAATYFSFLFNYNDSFKETLKFPLLQLSYYFNDDNKIKYYENCNHQSSYFPVLAFMHVPTDWKTNFSVDVVSYASGEDFSNMNLGVESALFNINWYSKHLSALDEPVLSDSLPTKIYRFTWLRTFHNPIVVRIENSNDSIKIYWKVCDGAGGYEPGKIIKNKSKNLTLNEWEYFVNNINSIDFWNLPSNQNEMLGTDGAQWILEGKELGKYHVVDRWSGGEIAKICLELLNLTQLKIKESDIY